MELITGGIYQGKKEYALNVLKVPEKNIIDNFNETVKELLSDGKDPDFYIDDILKNHPDAVIIVDEVGCGIIPLDKTERNYRVVLGRLTCTLSENAEHVYRVTAGLGIKLK